MDHITDCNDYGRCLFDPCTTGDICWKGLTCSNGHCVWEHLPYSTPQSSGSVATDVPSIAIPTLSIQPTSTIPIPTLVFEPTSTIPIPTLLTLASASPTSTASATATATPAASPAPEPTHNHALVYISIPLTLLSMLFFGITIYKRWRKKHPKPVDLDAVPVQIRSQPASAGLGTNNRMWTGKGHREYRGSASTMMGRGGLKGNAGQ